MRSKEGEKATFTVELKKMENYTEGIGCGAHFFHNYYVNIIEPLNIPSFLDWAIISKLI